MTRNVFNNSSYFFIFEQMDSDIANFIYDVFIIWISSITNNIVYWCALASDCFRIAFVIILPKRGGLFRNIKKFGIPSGQLQWIFITNTLSSLTRESDYKRSIIGVYAHEYRPSFIQYNHRYMCTQSWTWASAMYRTHNLGISGCELMSQ